MDRATFVFAIALVPALAAGGALAADAFPTKPIRIVVPYAASSGPMWPPASSRRARRGPGPVDRHREQGRRRRRARSTVRRPGLRRRVQAADRVEHSPHPEAPLPGPEVRSGRRVHARDKLELVADGNGGPGRLPAKSVQDLIALAKAKPGKLNYSSGGVGTSAHLAGATLDSPAGIKVIHIPLKGSVEITGSLLRGDTDFAFPVTATGIPQMKAGKLRALGVSSGARLKELPDVPTLKEAPKNELRCRSPGSGCGGRRRRRATWWARCTPQRKALARPSWRSLTPRERGGDEREPGGVRRIREERERKWGQIFKLTPRRRAEPERRTCPNHRRRPRHRYVARHRGPARLLLPRSAGAEVIKVESPAGGG